MIYVFIAAALLGVLVVIFKVMQRPNFLPKLPLVPQGNSLGKFSLHHNSTQKAMGLESSFPPSEFGRFVVFYLDDLLFYYGNGSKQYDQSERLRNELRKIMKGAVPPIWRFDQAARADAGGATITGELFEAGFSGSRVMGWQNQDECRVLGMSALVAYALMLPDAARTRHALTTLLRWQEEFGPMPAKGNSARAHAAYNNIQPLP